MKKKSVIYFRIYVAVTVLTVGTGCEGPPESLPSGWVFENEFVIEPYFVNIACSTKGVYIVTETKIYKYDGKSNVLDYQAPDGVKFWGFGFWGTKGWAVGEYEKKGFMVKYDGERWSETDLPPNSIEIIREVVPVSADTCWLKVYPDDRLVFWDGMELKAAPGSEHINLPVYSFTTHTLYGLRYPDDGLPKLIMTTDEGNTWVTEELPTTLNAHKIGAVSDIATVGDAFYYIATEDTNSRSGFEWMIIKRTGPVGDGEYEISFASPVASDFEELEKIAFSSPTRGIAAGYRTCVLYDGSRWYKEEKSAVNLNQIAADPRGGFWTYYVSALYYHP